MPELSYDHARTLVLQYLKQIANQPPSRSSSQCGVVEVQAIIGQGTDAGSAKNSNNQRLVCQILHELYLERVIATGQREQGIGPSRLNWPHFWVTDYGKAVLAASEYSPHDPGGYLNRLRTDIPDLDDVIIRYVDESVDCFRRDCLLASAVMIGVACEKAIILLTDTFGAGIVDPTKKAQFEADTRTWRIKTKHSKLMEWIDKVKNKLPGNLRDGLGHKLDGIFHLIRETRNDAGHPTGATIDQTTVYGIICLFPGYCRFIYALMDHFKQNPPMV